MGIEEKFAAHEEQVSARLDELTATVSAQLASFGRALDKIASGQKSLPPQRPDGGAGAGAPASDSMTRCSQQAATFSFAAVVEHATAKRNSDLRREATMTSLQSREVFGMERGHSTEREEVLAKEKAEKEAKLRALTRRGMLLPTSKARLAWDATSCSLIFFIALTLPFRVAFISDWSLAWTNIDFLVDLFFLCDILVNFRTVVFSNGELITDARKIARLYATTWLPLDAVSSVPIDWFVNYSRHGYFVDFGGPSAHIAQAGDSSAEVFKIVQVARIFKLVKLLRLLRAARLLRYIGRWEDHMTFINQNTLRLLKLLVGLFFFSHWNGCMQYFVASFDTVEGANGTISLHEDNWVVRSGIAAQQSPFQQWSWSFYHAMTQLLALSTGVVSPARDAELWCYLISILTGAALYAVFVASLTAVFSESGAAAREYRSKLDMLHQYMRNLHLPPELRTRLQTYYELCYPQRTMFDETAIGSYSSSRTRCARRSRSMHKFQHVLSALRVLNDEHLAREIADHLTRVVFIDDDTVIWEGEFAGGMYFISSGTVEVVVPGRGGDARGQVVATLGVHSYFGEMSLLNPEGRATASVRVRGFCEGYHLSCSAYATLLKQFPAFRDYLKSVAKLRLKLASQEGIDTRLSHGGGAGGEDSRDPATELDQLFALLNPAKRKLLNRTRGADAGQPRSWASIAARAAANGKGASKWSTLLARSQGSTSTFTLPKEAGRGEGGSDDPMAA